MTIIILYVVMPMNKVSDIAKKKSARYKYSLFLCLLFFALGLSACSVMPRHKPSNLKTPLAEKDFSAYIKKTKILIEEATKGKLEPKWVEARLPFEYKPDKEKCETSTPYQRGVLLIHGLTDSAFMFRDIGEKFNKNCYWVRSILLPGHGTIPGDLLNIQYREWINAVDSGIESFDKAIHDLYIVGFSTGATLTLHHVLRKNNPKNIKGLILISPGIKENTSLGFLAGWIGAIGKIIPRAAWLSLLPDKDKVKYESFPANAAAQFHFIAKELRDLADSNPPITTPVFMAISSADATVDPLIAKDYFCSQTRNPKNHMIWYTSEARFEKKDFNCPGGIVEQKIISDKTLGILNYSHLSLPVSPSNDYYGKDGEYKNCLAYTGNKKDLKICEQNVDAASKVKYGEKTDSNGENPVRRLTFNPEFENMMKKIFGFIKSLGGQ